MRTLSMLVGCVGILFSAVLAAVDPAYVGRWKINEEKSDFGTAFTFAPAEQGALRLTEADRSYIVRFDGKEYPHPLGGLFRWIRIYDRSWETTYTQNGKLVGNVIYRLSDDGQTLTVRPKSGPGSTDVFRRTSGERQGLAGVWSLKTASVSTLELAVAEGYETGVETCRISKVGDRGFSLTVHVNGKQVAVNTYTVSEDGQTMTDVSGPIGQPHTVVHERQR